MRRSRVRLNKTAIFNLSLLHGVIGGREENCNGRIYSDYSELKKKKKLKHACLCGIRTYWTKTKRSVVHNTI